jgi:protein involved in sex pheromone biosynthesis
VKRVLIAAAALGLVLTGCTSEADVASDNISKDADSFKVERQIVFYNGITGQYMLEIQGRCSIGNNDKAGEVSITCKTGPDEYKKHFLGLSDNVTYFAQQLKSVHEDAYHYKVLFRPEEIIPDIETQTSGGN